LATAPSVRVLDEADRGEMVLLFGPIDLPPAEAHVEHYAAPLGVARLPRSGWIQGFGTDMLDSTGVPIRVSYLHHMVLIDPDQRALFSSTALRLLAAGVETGYQAIPSSMGIPVHAGESLLINAAFHNPKPVGVTGLYVRIRLRFTPALPGQSKANIFPLYLDVMPAVGRKAFDLPPGISSRSFEARPAISGRLLEAGGHVHDFAIRLELEDVTSGKTLWEVAPSLDSAGHVRGVSRGSFWWRGGLAIRSDHFYRLTVTYDNPTGTTLLQGGMGTLAGVFVPGAGEIWPAVEKQNPDYVADLKFVAGPDGGSGMSGMAMGPSAPKFGEAAPGEKQVVAAFSQQPIPARAGKSALHFLIPLAPAILRALLKGVGL
jgi:hypothetical protein